VIVAFVDFEVATDDRASFDQWFSERVELCRAQEGCIAYEYLVDPLRPTRGVLFEAWETQEAMDRHIVFPPHRELDVEGPSRGMHDTRLHAWRQADGYQRIVVEYGPDGSVAGPLTA
jgi:quinol monooxygenase YgiN